MEQVNFKNNGKLKLLIIVGTRPEIIRLAAVIKKCRKYFDTILAHTGQNYDYNLNGVFFKDLDLDAPEVYMDANKNYLFNNDQIDRLYAIGYQDDEQLRFKEKADELMGKIRSGEIPIE